MYLIAGSAGRAFGNEFGAHAAGLRIERRRIKIGNPVEQTALADELVERLALGVLLGRAMIGVGAAERRGQGSADDPDTGEFGADATDDVIHAGLDCFARGLAVLAEIVDAFEPNHGGDAG